MAAAQKIIRKSARELGISYNTKNTAAHGTYRNYTVLLYLGDSASKPEILVSVCAGSVGAPLNPQEVAARIPEAAGCNCAADKYRVYLSFPIKGKQSDLTGRIVDTVRILIDYFERNAWDNCDETGNTGATSVYKVRGRLTFLTDFTAQYVQKTVAQDAHRNAQKQEKYLPGLLGALLGSLIGAVIVFIVARLGFISTISSAALGFAIVLGYRKLAGKISLPSAVLCVLLSAAVTYLVFRLDAAISIYKDRPDPGVYRLHQGWLRRSLSGFLRILAAPWPVGLLCPYQSAVYPGGCRGHLFPQSAAHDAGGRGHGRGRRGRGVLRSERAVYRVPSMTGDSGSRPGHRRSCGGITPHIAIARNRSA